MPHVIIRFRLPDEQTELNAAMQGREAKGVIWSVDQYCRNILKHGEPSEEMAENHYYDEEITGRESNLDYLPDIDKPHEPPAA
jgi:hypothetical protein